MSQPKRPRYVKKQRFSWYCRNAPCGFVMSVALSACSKEKIAEPISMKFDIRERDTKICRPLPILVKVTQYECMHTYSGFRKRNMYRTKLIVKTPAHILFPVQMDFPR
jgi:hypothetical protein